MSGKFTYVVPLHVVSWLVLVGVSLAGERSASQLILANGVSMCVRIVGCLFSIGGEGLRVLFHPAQSRAVCVLVCCGLVGQTVCRQIQWLGVERLLGQVVGVGVGGFASLVFMRNEIKESLRQLRE